jgi:hypothetical protein
MNPRSDEVRVLLRRQHLWKHLRWLPLFAVMGAMFRVAVQFEDPTVKDGIGVVMLIGCVLPVRAFLKDVFLTRKPISVISEDGIRIEKRCLLRWPDLKEARVLKRDGDKYVPTATSGG